MASTAARILHHHPPTLFFPPRQHGHNGGQDDSRQTSTRILGGCVHIHRSLRCSQQVPAVFTTGPCGVHHRSLRCSQQVPAVFTSTGPCGVHNRSLRCSRLQVPAVFTTGPCGVHNRSLRCSCPQVPAVFTSTGPCGVHVHRSLRCSRPQVPTVFMSTGPSGVHVHRSLRCSRLQVPAVFTSTGPCGVHVHRFPSTHRTLWDSQTDPSVFYFHFASMLTTGEYTASQTTTLAFTSTGPPLHPGHSGIDRQVPNMHQVFYIHHTNMATTDGRGVRGKGEGGGRCSPNNPMDTRRLPVFTSTGPPLHPGHSGTDSRSLTCTESLPSTPPAR